MSYITLKALEPKYTRSMYYSVRSDGDYALVTRLTDGRRVMLRDATVRMIDYLIKGIEARHPSLGTKPSRAFCREFDTVCESYFGE